MTSAGDLEKVLFRKPGSVAFSPAGNSLQDCAFLLVFLIF
ncbi:hypothetical protein AT236_01170 [Lactobacillus delbrueckii subsp. bulgaricus]|nr:hypothetical protein AT236_01170 [Lactobacillus delbrueckii subsp. bulgaricus]AQR54944.1 hypothetical protein BBD26_1717 [Lactobacillus delbrueckii subsp. bulgaricus]